ncbi:MAG: Crp/Fnr family transcriptional regulator [Sedimentibacter sp.]|uniref:Crp/Fnr family transcriptional regulator n=1 Tax=Sedimentibacter sp. TaxID=1960295 RepID=UPI0031580106
MIIEDTQIYPYVKDYLDKITVIAVKKGTCFSKPDNKDDQIYYILEGIVKVESVSAEGKKTIIDVISENEFAGQISYFRKSNFYGNSLAFTDIKLLCLKLGVINTLMNYPEFSSFFYFKTSARLYQMYKKMLMGYLFSQSELVSYYIIANSINGKFIFKSIDQICENVNISRRNLYNILNKYENEGVILKADNGKYNINKEKMLIENSDKVKKFMENSY